MAFRKVVIRSVVPLAALLLLLLAAGVWRRLPRPQTRAMGI